MKIIRDKIAEQAGLKVKTILAGKAFWLKSKLVEEAYEVVEAEGEEQLLEELADVYEVLKTLVHEAGFTWAQLTQAALDKRTEKGGFNLGHLWDGP